jgi:predicted phage tail protein
VPKKLLEIKLFYNLSINFIEKINLKIETIEETLLKIHLKIKLFKLVMEMAVIIKYRMLSIIKYQKHLLKVKK